MDGYAGSGDRIYKRHAVRFQRYSEGGHYGKRNGGYGYHAEDHVYMDSRYLQWMDAYRDDYLYQYIRYIKDRYKTVFRDHQI